MFESSVKYDKIFSKSMVKISKDLFEQERDMTMTITGKVGSGKSSLGIGIGLLLASMNNKKFNLLKNIIYYPDYIKIKDAIMEKDDYKPIVIDEAIRSVYKLNALTTDAKKLKILLAICRKRKKVLIFCLPKMQDFSSLMIDRVAMWFHIVHRDKNKGVCACFIPSGNFLDKTQWDLSSMSKTYEKLISKMGKIPVLDTVTKTEEYFSNFPNFVFAFEFYPLPKKIYKEYEQISWNLLNDLEESKQIEEQDTIAVNKSRNRLIATSGNLFYKEHKSYIEIQNLLSISPLLLKKYLKDYREKNNISYEHHEKEIHERRTKANKKAWQTKRKEIKIKVPTT